jgi:hypothetical protein
VHQIDAIRGVWAEVYILLSLVDDLLLDGSEVDGAFLVAVAFLGLFRESSVFLALAQFQLCLVA